MKSKITILLFALLIGFNFSNAQQDEECLNNLSIFSELVKQKKYDEAYEPWMLVRNKCPKFHKNIYKGGEKILKHKIENSTGTEKVAFLKDNDKLLDDGNKYYPKSYSKDKILGKKLSNTYKYKKELGLSDKQVYDKFDNAYKNNREDFKSPSVLLRYFKMAFKFYDEGPKTPKDTQALFDKYDDVNEKVEEEVNYNTKKLNEILARKEAGTAKKNDAKYEKFYQQTLEAYDKVSIGLTGEIDDIINCEILVPLYSDSFEANKDDTVWLQRAMNRMYAKGCKDEPLFLKLVERKNELDPNADTSFYLYLLTGEQKYFDQTISLETDPLKKAALYNKLANEAKGKGQYGKARSYYRKALSFNPSNGLPYLKIAQMYASSANNCGDSVFNKLAVYWLAEKEARKAGQVDSRLKSTAAKTAASYAGRAPTTAMIFQEGNKGQTIKIGCWIGASVKVP